MVYSITKPPKARLRKTTAREDLITFDQFKEYWIIDPSRNTIEFYENQE